MVGRRLVALGAVLVGLAATVVGQSIEKRQPPQVVGKNTPVNAGALDLRDINSHNSPTIVQSPTNPANVAIANRIDTPAFSCALHVSFDGGSRWRQTPIPVPAGEEPKCYAPDVAFGRNGALYLSFVTLKGLGNVPNSVWLARSTDGGRTLGVPTKVVGPLAFQVRLVADLKKPSRLYLSWLQANEVANLAFSKPRNPIQLLRSDDGGRTWQGPVQVNPPSRGRVLAPSPAVGPRGDLYIAYLDLREDRLDYEGGHEGKGGEPYPGRWQLLVARSNDGGKRWRESTVEPSLASAQRLIAFLPPFPSLAIDPGKGSLYLGFQDGRSGDSDVYVWASHDGGKSFLPGQRVNDTVAEDGTFQGLPKLGTSGAGRLDVIYYDRRGDPRNVLTAVSLQSSYDEGRTFERRIELSDRRFSSKVGFGSDRGLPDLGSRLGLISTPRRALAVWADTRSGTEASGKQDLVQSVVMFFDDRHDGPSEVLRYGGITMFVFGLLLLFLWVPRASPS